MPELLRDTIRRVADRGGNRPAVSLPGVTLTYRDIGDVADRGANLIAGLGYGEGDVVMARCGNTLAMLTTMLGCVRLGAVFMPVNALLSGAPLRDVMAHGGGSVAVVDAALAPELLALRSHLPALRDVVVAGGDAPAGCHSFERLLAGAAAVEPAAPRGDATAPARLIYTSGTTGRPKGVIWSRTTEAYHSQCYGDELVRIDPGEAVYTCLPLFHVTCQGTTLGTLWRGGHVHIDPGFDAFRFWERTRETRAVFFPYVGTILSVLNKRPRRPDDRDNPVRRVMGSAAPADRWHEIEERFDLAIEDVWGQTETASCWTLPHRHPARSGTVGRPAPRFEAALVRPDGAPPRTGEAGELWIRPLRPQVMFAEYLRDEEGTARAWTAEGWYRTGDRLHRDADGDYVFDGRLRDAIRRRGEMISPGPIEDAALRQACVAEAAAVGVPATDGVEEEVKLCIVAQPGAVAAPDRLHAALRRELPAFMVPRYIAVYDTFPKTPTTRVQKYRLQADGVAAAWDSRARRRVAAARAAGHNEDHGGAKA